jgi:hypothetical protein
VKLNLAVSLSVLLVRWSSQLHTEILPSADRVADRRPLLSTIRFYRT